jgi:hypothetical protein
MKEVILMLQMIAKITKKIRTRMMTIVALILKLIRIAKSNLRLQMLRLLKS